MNIHGVDVDNYNRIFGNYLHVDQSNLITGAIYLGNNYRKHNDYYGGYQGNYLKRIAALFPHKNKILHLYAGMINDQDLPGDKVDINPLMDGIIQADARKLSEYECLRDYDLIVADPPYGEDRLKVYKERYGCIAENLNTKKVFREMFKVTTPDAHVVWLDWSRPFYRSIEWKEVGAILYRSSTGHKDRSISIYTKPGVYNACINCL